MQWNIWFTWTALVLLLNGFYCGKKVDPAPPAIQSNCYKGQLAIKGACGNYTIKVLEGNMDTARISAQWTDPNTNTSYTNVFGLGNVCPFPASVNQGDTFYFKLDSGQLNNCFTCLAIYPTPPKKLVITVLPAPCP